MGPVTETRDVAPPVPPVPPELARIDADIAVDAAWFWHAFEDQQDLAHLSYPARRMLAVASVLFLRRGAVATSVRDIARAGGVSPGALYNHFDSKELLLYTVVHHGHQRLIRRLDHDVRPHDPPTEQLRAFVTAWVVGHLEHQRLAQLVRHEYAHLSGPRLDTVVRQRRTVRDRLAAIVAAGVADGSFTLFDDQTGPLPVAVMILDLCLSTTDWYDARRTLDPHALAGRYVTAARRLLTAS